MQAGDRVLVFGGGPIGTLIALVARQRGAQVAVAEIKPVPPGHAAQVRLGDGRAGAGRRPLANEWTDGTGVDVAFEVAGNPAAALGRDRRRARVGHGER